MKRHLYGFGGVVASGLNGVTRGVCVGATVGLVVGGVTVAVKIVKG